MCRCPRSIVLWCVAAQGHLVFLFKCAHISVYVMRRWGKKCMFAAVCCSVLQCVAPCVFVWVCVHKCVCYERLRWEAHVCCSVLQCVAVSWCMLSRVAVCRSVLQCQGVCCHVLQFLRNCSDFSVSRVTNSNWDSGLIWLCTEVDFRGVAILVESVTKGSNNKLLRKWHVRRRRSREFLEEKEKKKNDLKSLCKAFFFLGMWTGGWGEK